MGKRDMPIGSRVFRDGAWVGGLLLSLVSLSAHAQIFEQTQIIDQYLNPAIYGTNIQPGVTVATRVHPDYDPTGLRLGPFLILTKVTENLGYDSNVTGTTVGHGSTLVNTVASVYAVDSMRDGNIVVQGNVYDMEYLSVPEQSYTDWNANVTGTHSFGNDLLTVTAEHYTSEETPLDLGEPNLQSSISYRMEDLQAFYAIDFGHLQIQPGVDVSYYDFDNGRVDGVSYNQSYRDRVVVYPSVTTRYEFATQRDLILVIRDADASYLDRPSGLPTQQFNDISILGGVSYDVDGVVGFRLLGGYEERDFSSKTYKKIQAPIVEGALVWTPTELTSINASASRYITDTSSEGTVGETETTIKLSVDHELQRNIVLNLKAGFTNAEYVGSPGQDLYTVGFGATWKLNRLLRLGFDYRFTYLQGANYTEQNVTESPLFSFGGNYRENRFRLQLGVAF